MSIKAFINLNLKIKCCTEHSVMKLFFNFMKHLQQSLAAIVHERKLSKKQITLVLLQSQAKLRYSVPPGQNITCEEIVAAVA